MSTGRTLPFRMRLTRFAVLTILAAVPAGATAGILSMELKTLPEHAQDEYTAALPGWIAEATAGLGTSSSPFRTDSILIAPVVLGWAPEPVRDGAFPPLWTQNEHGAGAQLLVDETNRKIVDAFRTRNWGFATPAWLREQGAKLDKIGSSPLATGGHSYNGDNINGYAFVSEKLREWSPGDFGRLKNQYPALQSVALVRINTLWIYKGYSRLNGEGVVNYEATTSVTVRICDSPGSCASASSVGDSKAKLITPVIKAVKDAQQASNNGFAIGLASDYFSGVAVALIENILGVAPPPPLPPATGQAIISTMNGKCMDVDSGRFAAGTILQVWDCYPNHPNQMFEFVGGQIKARGFCVDAYGAGGNAGDAIGLYQCTGGPNQKWALKDGHLKGIKDRCIGIAGGNKDNGAKLVLWDCTGGAEQNWKLP
jgi:hypothetical protein